jgi:D-alanine--poly(phosphoribitol) ligase subunit 2
VPQGFVVLSPLPRTQAGKPDRTKILEAATEWVENAAAAAALAAKEGAGGDNTARVSAIVARILSENVGHALSPKVDDDLVAGGYLDSLTMVSLVVALQEEFGIQIPVVNLTPERFASIALIVEYLFPKDGQVFDTPDTGHYTPSATPTLNLLLTMALAALLIALFAIAPSDDKGPLTIRQWRQNKARCEGCATFVVAGSSQAAVNFSPAAMQPLLPEAKIFNLGLSTQPYSEVYLDRIEHSVARAGGAAGARGVLLVMTPVSVIPRKNDDEAAELLDMVKPDSTSRKTLDSARYFFHTRSLCEFAFGACNQHLYLSLRPDGWQTETMTGGPSPAEGAARMANFMRRWGAILHYDPANLRGLSARIKKWRSDGIHVYALRAPVPPVMRQAELAVQSYDEVGLTQTLSEAGATWLSIDDGRYETIDGWHMDTDNAVRFSEDVARQVASLEARTSEAR